MKRLVTFLAAVFFISIVSAQTPDKMSYQAVIRNSSNQLVTNTQVGMKISILQGLPPAYTAVYWEVQTPTTNANGLVSIEIGGTYSGFDTIHWSNGPYFIKTETDPNGGANYTITGESELLSVPYSLHSKTAESLTGGITETDPVFGASPAAGITGTNITNWNNNMLPAGLSEQTLYHNGTSWVPASNLKNDGAVVRINDLEVLMDLDVQMALNLNALPGTSPMYVLSNYRVNNLNADLLDDKHAADFSAVSHSHSDLWTLTGNAGTTAGTNFVGTTDNVPLEFRVNNTQAGKISVGSTFFGYRAGINQNGPTYNTAIGSQALSLNTVGTNNTVIGDQTMYHNNGGYSNTAVGQMALFSDTLGYMNTALGLQAGYSCMGNRNVFLGYQAGYNETGSDKLYISNSNTSTPLIYGDFSKKTVTINDTLHVKMVGIGTTTPGHKLDVSGGSIRTTGQLISTQATGTAPLTVNSTTAVTNLNADMVDGYHAGNMERIVASGSVFGGNYVDITIPNYYPFTLQLSSGWPHFITSYAGGQALVQGAVNDGAVGLLISFSNGADLAGAPGVAAVTSTYRSANMSALVNLFTFGGTGGNLYTVSTMGSNLTLRITAAPSAVEVMYKLVY